MCIAVSAMLLAVIDIIWIKNVSIVIGLPSP